MVCKYGARLGMLLVASLISSIFLIDSAFAVTRPGKDRELYAVIVGVGQYQDPNIPSLNRAAKDAKDFHAFLKERKYLFSKAHLTMLLNEEATRANVARALRQRLRRADPDDIVIIYLSGHGLTDPVLANEFYFATHDARLDNLFGTALLMNDANLFKGIRSDNVLLLTDACHSGGFNTGLDRLVAKSANRFFSIFEHSRGRIAMSSSRPEEESYEKLLFGNSIFTHFLLKGLRGGAAPEFKSGVMTVENLYSYVHDNTRLASKGLQNPQLYAAKGVARSTPVFLVPKSAGTLDIKVQFFYETENNEIKPLTDNSVLKSGQHVGVAFRSQSDCYVYIYWWDSTGKVGRLFPNPKLTEGTGKVVAGKTYWLPYQQGERWYVLDNNPGTETVYFVASRQGNQKLEELYQQLASGGQSQAPPQVASQPQQSAQPQQSQPRGQQPGAVVPPAKQGGQQAAEEMKRELSLMGFANYTVPKGVQKATFTSKEQVFEDRENLIRVSGAEAVFKLQFKHEAKRVASSPAKTMTSLKEPIHRDPTVVIHEVKTVPRSVTPSSKFNLVVSYSASNPAMRGGKCPVQIGYSILRDGKVLFTKDPKAMAIPNGAKSEVKFVVTAAPTTGVYTIESKAVHQTATDTKSVQFEIR